MIRPPKNKDQCTQLTVSKGSSNYERRRVELPIYCYVYILIGVDTYLGRIYIVLSDATERRLRLAVVTRLGGKKGDLSGAIEEAVTDWLKKDVKRRN